MINIIISSDPRYRINRLSIRNAVLQSLMQHRILGRVEIGINIVGGRKIHELNRKFRAIDAPTDILSFALEEGNPTFLQHYSKVGFVAAPDQVLRLGDIVISYPHALEDAVMDGVTVDEEIKNLVEHGVSHLLGIHHPED